MKRYLTLTVAVGGGLLIGSGEVGKMYVLDPPEGVVHEYEYHGYGVGMGPKGGISFGVNASFELGYLETQNLSNIEGPGHAVTGFAAVGFKGASFQVYPESEKTISKPVHLRFVIGKAQSLSLGPH